ncbi:major facilitator superfamily domain-containing protein 12-like [Thrips palmi]|uniref:Major facilitator superfamily domain-containing protein 12-like n=1 Tax=Thrips palmi TaxID=161013 RepID=A0A6P8Z942_THRPL|nr:major facilitator superfamily domain-containing protein 12-like [Thrips palmi]XP_034246921.1 major facilitator superfamily domain-containing protein 12-like [Thrips palmi]XP_034246923.1 major facilitator superfamily domain-containing protein 12-like [Thrips palmi]XP_034246924.1 major facilitator superfamily domain-containing protein 12-like [Thrips palmi]XP_034246925.1 major facilitator superfamily domain-containing protein 12-like [Thrips palmi]
MERPRPALSLLQRLGYSVGHVQNDVCASMWFTYLLVFFQMVLGWPAHVAGIVMLIGQIADALSTPFVGLQADRRDKFWLCRYGRRKTWHLIGTICVLVSFPFLFSPCIGCRNAPGDYWDQLVYFGAFVVVFQFGWAAVQISHLSLIPDLTPDQHTRTGLIACRYTFTVIASVLVYVITWATFHLSTGDEKIGPEDTTSFQIVVASGLGIGIVCSILFHAVVKEAPVTDAEDDQTSANGTTASVPSKGDSQKTVKEQLCSVALYQVALVYMSTRLFANLSQVYTPLYLSEQRLGAESLAIVPLVMFLSSFCTSFVTRPMNKYLGRKIAHLVGCLIGAGGCVWVWLGAGQLYTTYEVYAVAVLLGASSSIQLVTSLGLTADLIGQDTNTGAFVYGAMSFVDKLSNGIAIAILQAYFNDNYRNVLAYVCGGSCVLGALSLAVLVVCRTRSLSKSDANPPAQFESSYSEI